MSEQIPESIPTSADPRSKRPTKKSRPNAPPSSETALALSALFSDPSREIHIPSSTTLSTSTSAPPEIVANVQGSSAGAGSGEFHVYKASRRREYERLKAMDEEVRNEGEGAVWEKEKREREERDREKTRRNREKREKLKKKKKGGNGGETHVKATNGGGIKARANGPSDEGDSKDEAMAEVQQVGVIIHDDD